METKTLKVEWEGKPAEIIIQEFDYGTWMEIKDQAVDVKMIGRQIITKPNQSKATILGLIRGIKSAPFEVNDKNIRALPRKLGEYLYDEISKLNGMGDESEDDIKNLEGQEIIRQA